MRVILVGQPNVGKSSVLNLLCGPRAVVSNYPGTTVDSCHSPGDLPHAHGQVFDTPGLYSFATPTPERALVDEALRSADAIINVIDGADLSRHLPLTIQLLMGDVPLLICVNQLDRAKSLGVKVDLEALASQLGVPVVGTSAALGQGRRELLRALVRLTKRRRSDRPAWIATWTDRSQSEQWQGIEQLTSRVLLHSRPGARSPEAWMKMPWLFTLLGVASLYMGAVVIVRFLAFSEVMVGQLFKPIGRPLPGAWPEPGRVWLQYLVEGLVVPFGVVLPAMVVVYLTLAWLEDSGLFVRFAALAHVPCRALGLSGPCMIPLLLGTGCRIAGVLGSRVIAGQRERNQTCALLAIAVPCGATLAVTGALVAHKGAQVGVVMTSVLVAVVVVTLGFRGPGSALVMEISPLRWPAWGNIAYKTITRMQGFFLFVLPILTIGNILVRVSLDRGVFNWLGQYDRVTMEYLGLSGTALAGISMTVLQRYLAPLVLLSVDLSARQATIASSMIMISFPCLPVALLCWRELGPRSAVRIYVLALSLPLLVGHVLHRLLPY